MSEIIKRKSFRELVVQEFEVHPVVAILGPRQCGKTTVATRFIEDDSEPWHLFDLENPRDVTKLEDPLLALEHLEGTIVIDEIQRCPELFPVLRVLVDQKKNRRFLILGSASRDLIKQSSETLAGRIGYLELTPFTLEEISIKRQRAHWVRGGFPLSFLAKNEASSYRWRESFVSTFLERDIPNLGINIPAKTLRRFWTMLAHYHGQVINFSQIANSIQSTDTTVRKYLDILEGTYMVRVLLPWHENVKKRQVKSPKIYIRDTGLLHVLLGLKNEHELLGHPKCGASWEGYCLEECVRAHPNCEKFFWATYSGAELDLLLVDGFKKSGFEFKFTSTPKVTKSMRAAIDTLSLDLLTVVIPGNDEYALADDIYARGIETFSS